MLSRSVVLASVLVTLSATAAQNDPVITPTLMLRGVNSSSGTEGSDPGSDDQYEATTEQDGSFNRSGNTSAFGDKGSTASGDVEIRSEITDFKIFAEGNSHAETSYSDPDGSASAAGIVYFQMLFTVPVDTTFSVYGRYKLTGSGIPPELEFANKFDFSIQGADPDFNAFNIAESVTGSTGPDHEYFFYTQRVKANTQIVMQCIAQVASATLTPGSASGDFDFFFTIDFGDSDEDGLVDDWENAGIDIDNDGTPEIDLPAMGADPDKKNLFVELDSQTGVTVSQTAIDMVEQAFAQAPNALVDNPDGTNGIILNVVVDESDLTNEEYDGNGWPAEFDAAKADSFGTAALRDHPQWDVLKEAYKLVFRYGIWGQTIYKTKTRTDGTTYKSYFSGKSELPGNDFFVAAGEVGSWYSDATMRTNALAGTFMHEFGHSLGLRHGGHENKNYKPNYLSVMNYAYQLPKKQNTAEGTAAAKAWHLDYARTGVSTLNEESLSEGSGLDGPSGRLILFNTAADSDSPALMIADADASDIDWNRSNSTDLDPVSVDLTRFRGTEDALDASLTAQSDWDKIHYPLSGASDFNDGSHSSSDAIEPFSEEDFNEQNNYAVYDRTSSACPADLNGDGIVDQGDIQSFIALFLVQDLAVDFNGDGIVDLGDIQVFIANFLEGC